jgi:DNA-nicking Smr family endonuclease
MLPNTTVVDLEAAATRVEAITGQRFYGMAQAVRVQNGGMAAKRPVVSPEDQALFLAAIDGAKPLSGQHRDRVAVPPPPPSPVRVVELPSAVKLTVEGDGRSYTARAPGVSRAQASELRNGKVRAEETLDLHGMTVEAGLARLREFVVASSKLWCCVLIVHGRGLHSEHGAPLREAVLAELLGPLSGFVHALATAAPADGGEGATYLALRGSP